MFSTMLNGEMGVSSESTPPETKMLGNPPPLNQYGIGYRVLLANELDQDIVNRICGHFLSKIFS